MTGPAVYVRFHGGGQDPYGAYSRDQLRGWADWLGEAAGDGHAIYAYFNNDLQGHAVRDALTLRDLLRVAVR